MESKERKINGFTIIELLVSMFIIIVLSTILVARYRGANPDYTLTQAAQKMVSDIRRAQNMSMNGTEINSTTGYSGYGIYMKPSDSNTSYKFYADKNGNQKFDSEASDQKIGDDIRLPSKVVIDSITFGSLVNRADIFFLPPNPTTFINGSSNGSNDLIITLKEQSTSHTKTVRVTLAGLIEAQ
jgi:type II secretory pathway pseudopilin PulG